MLVDVVVILVYVVFIIVIVDDCFQLSASPDLESLCLFSPLALQTRTSLSRTRTRRATRLQTRT